MIPGDILHFITNPRRWHMNPPLWATRIPDDMISLDDPMATVGFVMSALRYSVDARMWRFLITR